MRDRKLFLLFFLVIIIIILFVVCPHLKAEGEKSDLKELVDSQGNVYRIDKENKIYTDGIPHPNRQPATVENLSYYYNQSLLLEANGYLEEAIKMYYEILCLPKVNQSVINARIAIGLRVKRLYNTDRTKDLIMQYFNIKSLEEGDLIQYTNKKFHFAFKYLSSWKISKEIIEDKERNTAIVTLVTPALLDAEGNVVDPSFAIIAERIPDRMQLSEFLDIWDKRTPNRKRIDRKVLNSRGIKNKFIAHFRGRDYYGEEIFFVKNKIGYYVSFTAGPLFLYELTKDNFHQIINTLELK